MIPESKLDLLDSFLAGRAEMGGAMDPRGCSTPVVVGWTACMSTLIESGCRTDGDADRSVRTSGDAAAGDVERCFFPIAVTAPAV